MTLAIATAAMNAGVDGSTAAAGSDAATMDGYQAALVVSVIVAIGGLAIAGAGLLAPARERAVRFKDAWQASYAGDAR